MVCEKNLFLLRHHVDSRLNLLARSITSRREMASRMGISSETVKDHMYGNPEVHLSGLAGEIKKATGKRPGNKVEILTSAMRLGWINHET